MCRNIRQLHNFEPPASEEEVHDAALQLTYRKVSGSNEAVAGERRGVRAGRGRRGRRLDAEAARLAGHQRSSEEPRGRGGQAAGEVRSPLRRLGSGPRTCSGTGRSPVRSGARGSARPCPGERQLAGPVGAGPDRPPRRPAARCGPSPTPPRSGSRGPRRFEIGRVGAADLIGPARGDVLHHGSQGVPLLLVRVRDLARRPQHHHRAVVERVMERRRGRAPARRRGWRSGSRAAPSGERPERAVARGPRAGRGSPPPWRGSWG